VGYDRKASARHAREDSPEAYLCKASAGVITGTVVGLGWVLRRERRLALMVEATTALLIVLGIDHVGLGGTPPAIVDERADYEKEGEDWRVKRGEQVSRVLAND